MFGIFEELGVYDELLLFDIGVEKGFSDFDICGGIG